jgi:hypothetical protein
MNTEIESEITSLFVYGRKYLRNKTVDVQCVDANSPNTQLNFTTETGTDQTIKPLIAKHFAQIVIRSRREQNLKTNTSSDGNYIRFFKEFTLNPNSVFINKTPFVIIVVDYYEL